MLGIGMRLVLFVALAALPSVLSGCNPCGEYEGGITAECGTDLVIDYRPTPADRSGLPAGQPVAFTVDVYIPRSIEWYPSFDQVLRDSIRLVDLTSNQSVTPAVTIEPVGKRDDVRRVTVSSPSAVTGSWGLRFKSDRVRAATRSLGGYDFEHCPGYDCFDKSSDHNEFFATVGSCPHLTSYKWESALEDSSAFRLRFSEAVPAIPVVRGRRYARKSGSSNCRAFDADFDLVATRVGPDEFEVSVDSEMRRCIERMTVVFPKAPELSLGFNRDFTCEPAEKTFVLEMDDFRIDVGNVNSLMPGFP